MLIFILNLTGKARLIAFILVVIPVLLFGLSMLRRLGIIERMRRSMARIPIMNRIAVSISARSRKQVCQSFNHSPILVLKNDLDKIVTIEFNYQIRTSNEDSPYLVRHRHHLVGITDYWRLLKVGMTVDIYNIAGEFYYVLNRNNNIRSLCHCCDSRFTYFGPVACQDDRIYNNGFDNSDNPNNDCDVDNQNNLKTNLYLNDVEESILEIHLCQPSPVRLSKLRSYNTAVSIKLIELTDDDNDVEDYTVEREDRYFRLKPVMMELICHLAIDEFGQIISLIPLQEDHPICSNLRLINEDAPFNYLVQQCDNYFAIIKLIDQLDDNHLNNHNENHRCKILILSFNDIIDLELERTNMFWLNHDEPLYPLVSPPSRSKSART